MIVTTQFLFCQWILVLVDQCYAELEKGINTSIANFVICEAFQCIISFNFSTILGAGKVRQFSLISKDVHIKLFRLLVVGPHHNICTYLGDRPKSKSYDP